MNYSEKLRDPRWQRLSLSILNRDQFTCQLCSDTETELQIHHKEYLPGHEPWEYPMENFITYCKHCHAVVEDFKEHKVLVISKNLTQDGGLFLNSIVSVHGDLRWSIHYYNGTLNYIIGIRQDTFLDMEKLFQHAKKLTSAYA